MELTPQLTETVRKFDTSSISNERKEILDVLVTYIQAKIDVSDEINLNFICTHNSRRSQFSQIWAQTAANHYNIHANCYSGGVEVTAFNERAVESIKRSGFKVTSKGEGNPMYYILSSNDANPIATFSKLYDDPINPTKGFAAIMTCSHADENCPFIAGTEKRIPVRYEDPKEFDNTSKEAEMYDERSRQIGTEMFYVFSKLTKK